jgi:hypothetical protein
MTLYTIALWFYSILASLVFGASVYETLVVHPAWSRQPPESFVSFVGEPLGRMDIAAFWKPVAPLFALSGVAALALAFRAGTQSAPAYPVVDLRGAGRGGHRRGRISVA